MIRPSPPHAVTLGLVAGLSATVWFAGCDRSTLETSSASGPTAAAEDAPPPPRAARAKVDPDVWPRFAASPVQRVIVEIADPLGSARPSPDESATRAARAARVKQRRMDLADRKTRVLDRLAQRGGRAAMVRYEYPAFRLFALELDAEQIRVLEISPEVTAVFADRKEQVQLSESLPYCHAPWFHQSRGTGAGTAVAIIDTPIRYEDGAFGTCPHAGSPGCSVVDRLSFADETSEEVIAKEDEYGKTSHGTNVGGIALGVAPDTELVSLNVFHSDDADGDVSSYVSDQVQALDWVASHAASYHIVAVNMSVGGTRDDPWPCNHDDPRYDVIRTLRADHDVLTVVASGNAGEQNAVNTPACISLAVTVGAQFDTDLGDYPKSCSQPDPYVGEMACFSNLSGMLDLVAPGVHVDAAGILKTGTSMAAPHVAGAIAAWQSWFLSANGSFKDAPWMHRRLLADSTFPMVHSDGRRFVRLAMNDQSFEWTDAHSFPGWYRESSGNSIPSGSPGVQESLTVTGKGYDVDGVYLYLEVIHLSPQDVEVTLESPSGATATVGLPAGQAHFNGIIGRMVEPGAWSALGGSPVDGTWTLSLRDTQAADQGHYLQAALFFAEQGCAPSCEDEGCGDDLCGGSCGEPCLIGGACQVAGSPQPADPCRGCDPNVSTTQWSPIPGSCDDGDPCTEGDTCNAGHCGGSAVDCSQPGPCQQPGHCDQSAGGCVYPPGPDGIGCDDGDLCTSDDVCQQGVCVGHPVTCPPPGQCQQQGICSTAEQGCVYPPAADGTPCSGGSCSGGVCAPSPDEDGGCSCSSTLGHGRGKRPGWWLLLVLGGLLGRLRRNRPSMSRSAA